MRKANVEIIPACISLNRKQKVNHRSAQETEGQVHLCFQHPIYPFVICCSWYCNFCVMTRIRLGCMSYPIHRLNNRYLGIEVSVTIINKYRLGHPETKHVYFLSLKKTKMRGSKSKIRSSVLKTKSLTRSRVSFRCYNYMCNVHGTGLCMACTAALFENTFCVHVHHSHT